MSDLTSPEFLIWQIDRPINIARGALSKPKWWSLYRATVGSNNGQATWSTQQKFWSRKAALEWLDSRRKTYEDVLT